MVGLALLVCAQLATSEPDAGALEADAGVVLALEAPAPPPEPGWWDGEHLTGEWGGVREWLAKHGVVIDFVYAGEVFMNAAASDPGQNGDYTGHFDLAVTVDTEALGLWPGGRFYVLGQNNHGVGINAYIGSATEISNIESRPYFQLGEFFFEQVLFGWLRFRLGKQDTNRDFGTPRFGGNFINNNFGMLPSSPLPSYPTNGLGALVVVQPVWWLQLKASIFEGRPQISSLGFDSAFAKNAGFFLINSVNVTHHYGLHDKHQGTSSVGFYRQQGTFTEVQPNAEDGIDLPAPRTFNESWGFYVQNDERFYLHPEDETDPTSVNVIARIGWSQPDRNNISLFGSVSVAYHGLGPRKDDTIGVGFGGFSVNQQVNGTPGRGQEWFVEVFYKWRMTRFMSLQPDLQYIRSPGGDGRDALLVGTRLKFKF